jgi:hypothetical protein
MARACRSIGGHGPDVIAVIVVTALIAVIRSALVSRAMATAPP